MVSCILQGYLDIPGYPPGISFLLQRDLADESPERSRKLEESLNIYSSKLTWEGFRHRKQCGEKAPFESQQRFPGTAASSERKTTDSELWIQSCPQALGKGRASLKAKPSKAGTSGQGQELSYKTESQLLEEHQGASQSNGRRSQQCYKQHRESDLLSNTSFWVLFGGKGKLSSSVLPLAGHQQGLLALFASQFSQNS